MPYVNSAGTRIYWREEGSGPPVLFIMGLSFSHDMWFRVLEALGGRVRAVLLDNRGVGRSECPRGPYTLLQMARDAAAVLDAAGISSAHIVGASMGGMIAQELALSFPERVESLLLACTSHGGLRSTWPRLVSPYHFDWSRILYSPTTPPERIAEDIAVQRTCRCTMRGLCNQLAGILVWSSYARLPRIRIPALVVHGDSDRLIPPENGRIVAARIPGARFQLVPNAGHILTTDQPELSRQILLDFLHRLETSRDDLISRPFRSSEVHAQPLEGA